MTNDQIIEPLALGAKLTKADAGKGLDEQGLKPKKLADPKPFDPLNPNGRIALIASVWNDLTVNEQESWNTAAIGFPAKNKYGDIYTPSGYQVFMKLNLNLQSINLGILRSGPVPNFPTLPPIEPPSGDPPELLKFTFTGGVPPLLAIQVFACNQVQTGSNFRKGKEKMLGIAYGNETGVFDFTGLYQNLFGQVKPKALIFFRFVPISQDTGESGVEVVINYVVPDYIPVPKLQVFKDAQPLTQISVGKNYIVGFRVNGFNLIDNMILHLPIDPADRFKISTSKNGPWVNDLSIPLNELRQPVNNVFFMRFSVAAPSLVGAIVEISSTGADPLTYSLGGEAIDQFITPLPNPAAFGDIYVGIPSVLELDIANGALRSDINYSVTGPTASNFKLSNTPLGPWLSTAVTRTHHIKNAPNPKLYVRALSDAVGALAAELNYASGSDIVAVMPISANPIPGVITSANIPGDSFGNNAIGVPIVWDFAVDGIGLQNNPTVYSFAVVNCTVEYSLSALGPWSPLLPLNRVGNNLPLTQVFFKAIPTALGAFSWQSLTYSMNSNTLVLAYDGVGV